MSIECTSLYKLCSTNACMCPHVPLDAQRRAFSVPRQVVLERGCAAEAAATRVSHALCRACEGVPLLVLERVCASQHQTVRLATGGGSCCERVPRVVRQLLGAAAGQAPAGVVAAVVGAAAEPELLK